MNPIKVFIVEDSILMQKIIEDILSADPDIVVVGKTKYGKEALHLIAEKKPDVVTLDINLPDMDGLSVLKELMAISPVRVMMLSAYTQQGAAVAIKALELGALDFMPKPSGEISLDLYNFKEEMISKVKLISNISVKKTVQTESRVVSGAEAQVKKLVVIGASTGGPKAIMDVMSHLPGTLDAAFLIVQHMPKGFTKSFAERLSWYSGVKTKEAEDNDQLLSGAAYVAPAGYHMIIEKHLREDSYLIRLDETSLVNYVRPAVDVTMRSAGEIFARDRILGVVLTGMGKDGKEGAKVIKERGGKIIAQDEQSSVVYGMPKAVAESGIADEVLPLEEIPNKIIEYLTNE